MVTKATKTVATWSTDTPLTFVHGFLDNLRVGAKCMHGINSQQPI